MVHQKEINPNFFLTRPTWKQYASVITMSIFHILYIDKNKTIFSIKHLIITPFRINVQIKVLWKLFSNVGFLTLLKGAEVKLEQFLHYRFLKFDYWKKSTFLCHQAALELCLLHTQLYSYSPVNSSK